MTRPIVAAAAVAAALLVPAPSAPAAPFAPIVSGGPYGAEMSGVFIDPNDANHVIATGSDEGVWHTSDGGASWAKPPDWEMPYASAVTFDPYHDNRVYAGAALGSMWRSNDDGRHWTQVRDYDSRSYGVVGVVVTPDVVLAATRNAGFVRSDDAGATWHTANTGMPTNLKMPYHDVTEMANAASRPGRVYATLQDGRVFTSSDAGAHWSATSLDMPSSCGASGIAVSRQDPRVVYVAGCGDVERTTDGGSTWAPVALPATDEVFGIALDPQDDTDVYVSIRGGVTRSTDGGATFGPVASVFEGQSAWHLAIAASNRRVLWAETLGGIFVSRDSGQTWTPATTGILSEWFVHAVASNPANPAAALAGTSAGLWRTTDGGASWQGVENGIDPGLAEVDAIAIDPTDYDRIFVSGMNELTGEVHYVSHDGGLTWAPLFVPNADEHSTVVVDPTNSHVLYVGNETGVDRSTDDGLTWTTLRILPFPNILNVAITRIAVDPDSPQRLYALSPRDGLYTSPDGGVTWTKVRPGTKYGSWQRTVLAADPTRPGRVFYGVGLGHLQVSSDNGVHWHGTPLQRPTSIMFDTSASPAAIYVTTDKGAFRSTDGGRTWDADERRITGGQVDSLSLGGRRAVAGARGLHRVVYLGARKVYRTAFMAQTPNVYPTAGWSSRTVVVPTPTRTLHVPLGCERALPGWCRGTLRLFHAGRLIAHTPFAFRSSHHPAPGLLLPAGFWAALHGGSAQSVTLQVISRGPDRTRTTARRSGTLVRG